MAQIDSNARNLAKRLAVLTVEAGDQARDQIVPALERLVSDRPQAQRRAILQAYLTYLRREVRANELVIEHAGPLGDAQVREIESTFAARTGRTFTVRTRPNPDLIGGLRLIQDDNIYDASISGRLARLAGSAS